jgi:hypothetical protein
MKKIGFIDLSIDEWHANNYPQMIRSSALKDAFDVSIAWEETPGGTPLAEWCDEHKVQPAASLEQVVEESDCLVVLAPSNPEVHERLSDIPLRSGKPTYIDKPFTTDRASAERIFQNAADHNTPMMSSSALRFGSALQDLMAKSVLDEKANFVSIVGGGSSFEEYSIHIIEMLTMTMGVGAARIMQCGRTGNELTLIDYDDGRRAILNQAPVNPFTLFAQHGDTTTSINEMNDFFPRFIDAMLMFFDSGTSAVPQDETIEIVSIMETAIQGLAKRDEWLTVSGR